MSLILRNYPWLHYVLLIESKETQVNSNWAGLVMEFVTKVLSISGLVVSSTGYVALAKELLFILGPIEQW